MEPGDAVSRSVYKLIAVGHAVLDKAPSDPPTVRAIVAALLLDMRRHRA